MHRGAYRGALARLRRRRRRGLDAHDAVERGSSSRAPPRFAPHVAQQREQERRRAAAEHQGQKHRGVVDGAPEVGNAPRAVGARG
eukprot:1140276-Prorocentrum_minimum.AAC.1